MADIVAGSDRAEAQSELRSLTVVSIAHWYSHYVILVLPMLFPFLKERLGVGFVELGFALTVFAVVSGLTQAPLGYVVDRFGARKLLILGVSLGGTAFVLLGMNLSYPWLIACAALLGLANSVYHPSDYALLAANIDGKRIGRAFSIHTFSGFFGGAVAPAIVAALVVMVGGAGALIASGVIGFVVALLILAFPIPEASAATASADSSDANGGPSSRADAGDHHADGLLHAARPVERRHQHVRRQRADERLRPVVLDRQHRADRLPRRERGRRSRRRLPRRPHAPPRRRCRRLLCRQRGHHRPDRDVHAAPGAADRDDDGRRLPRRRDRAVTRHAGAKVCAARRRRPRLRHRLDRLQHGRHHLAAAVRLDHGSVDAARRVLGCGRLHGADRAAGAGD